MWTLPDSLAGYASSTFNMSTKHWPNTGQPLGEHNLLSWHGAMKSPGIITIPLLSRDPPPPLQRAICRELFKPMNAPPLRILGDDDGW